MRRRGFLFGLLALPAAAAIWFVSRNRVIVGNDSGQMVHALSVDVCERTILFGDVPPGGTVSARFGTPADESVFDVRGRLADGTVIDDFCGYVVWEDYGAVFHITIRPDGGVACK